MDEMMSTEGKIQNMVHNVSNIVHSSKRKLSMTEKKFRGFVNKSKNARFYKKYLGRLEGGAWKRYASEARVTENDMRGDPLLLLKDDVKQYIVFISKAIDKVYNQLSLILQDNEKDMFAIRRKVENFSKRRVKTTGATLKRSKDTSLSFMIERAVDTKIADILLDGNKRENIYGYTRETIIHKGPPPPNHTIVSLIVENPEEQPTEQRVTDIFETPESIHFLADIEKDDVFDIFRVLNQKTTMAIDSEKIADTVSLSKMFIKHHKRYVDKYERDELKEIAKGVNIGLIKLDKMKSYVLDCITVYYDLIIRIDTCARKCLEAVLDVENRYRDPKYKTGLRKFSKNDKKEKDDDDYDFYDYRGNRRRNRDGETREEKRKRFNDISKIGKRLNKGNPRNISKYDER